MKPAKPAGGAHAHAHGGGPEDREHREDLARLRAAAPAFAAVHLSFALVLAIIAAPLGANPMTLVLHHLVGAPGPLALAWVARGTPSRTVLITVYRLGVVPVAASLGLIALDTGGLSSPFGAGLALTAPAFVLLPQPLRAAWSTGVLALVPYPIVVVAGTLLSSGASAFGDARAVVTFATYLVVHATLVATIVFAGHLVWTLRRRVFVSRSLGSRYVLKRRLGRGGMGEVWAARDGSLEREVAVKILTADDESEPRDVRLSRFEREVLATSRLAHPNTVRIYDFGVTDDGLFWYAMELLEGEPMGALVRREGALEPGRAVHLVAQAARALAEAHSLGMVHRDVKPDNLFVSVVGGEPDFLKVLDFGIVKAEGSAELTRTGTFAGTPAYASPEQLSGERVTPASDVYSLGIVLFFALTGTPPFEGESARIAVEHLQREPPRLDERAPGLIAPDLEVIVARCLAKAAQDRFADGAALALALASTNAAHLRSSVPSPRIVSSKPPVPVDTSIPTKIEKRP